MAIRRHPTVVIFVDYADDGLYAHARANVINSAGRFRVRFGANPSSNPERPVIQSARGRLRLLGAGYVPTAPNFLGDLLQRRHLCKLEINGEIAWEGYMQAPREVTNGFEFDLEGKLSARLSATVAVPQVNPGAFTNSAEVLAGLAASVGESALNGSQLATTELGIYEFQGRTGRYLSEFSRVSGTMPIETPTGHLGIYDPTYAGSASTDLTIGSATHDVRGADEAEGVDHLRNRALVYYATVTATIGPTTVSEESGSDFGQSGHFWSGGNTLVVDLPALAGGARYKNLRFTARAQVLVPTSGVFHPGSTFRIDSIDWIDGEDDPNPGSAITAAIDNDQGGSGAIVITVPGSVFSAASWRWTLVQGGSLSTNIGQGVFGSQLQVGITVPQVRRWYLGGGRVTYELTYEIAPPASAQPTIVTNPASIALWGVRTLEMPPYFRLGAANDIQDRIDALAIPRTLTTLTLPLGQATPALANEVRDIEPGDYINVAVFSPARRTDIHSHFMVMSVEYDLRPGRAAKRLNLIRTARRVARTRFRWGISRWGGTDVW